MFKKNKAIMRAALWNNYRFAVEKWRFILNKRLTERFQREHEYQICGKR